MPNELMVECENNAVIPAPSDQDISTAIAFVGQKTDEIQKLSKQLTEAQRAAG